MILMVLAMKTTHMAGTSLELALAGTQGHRPRRPGKKLKILPAER